MSEERIEQQTNRYLRPYASLPTTQGYDYTAYLTQLEDNLRGPIRQFRSRMLDIGNLMCVDTEQRKVFRDMVFSAERDMTKLLDEWVGFYFLSYVKPAIWREHELRTGTASDAHS